MEENISKYIISFGNLDYKAESLLILLFKMSQDLWLIMRS